MKVWLVLRLVLYFLWEVVLSNLRVIQEVLSPRFRMRPGILAVPLEGKSDLEIALFANMITLTPGTLSVHVSRDRRVLFVHNMYAEDPQAAKEDLKGSFERRVLEVTR
ncbi:Na+/H+ antiporter subunit E [Thermus thermamylovorans]|uniref:Sodium:proton antiporter n=1 Tax=Thermus thermamylovorans TaxID=2509362 RepID=A0A4V2IV06_9DEIN|nr:Na+/H+ antiporter subunit E [Thermus thermamylovorans]TBH20137.1 sodium:proton antiporter [Thermus thermamylovorans]